MHWKQRGACLNLDSDLFFSEEQWEIGRLVCGVCPVRRECLTWAVENHQAALLGIWGGATPDERETLRARSLEISYDFIRLVV